MPVSSSPRRSGLARANTIAAVRKFIPAPARPGAGAIKFEWHQSDYDGKNRTKHAELRTKPLPEGESERWYGFSIYLPADGMKVDSQPEIICQWHSYPDRHLNEPHSFPPLAISHAGANLRIKWLSDTRPVTPKRDKTLSGGSSELGKAPLNRWIDFVVHVKWEPFGKGLLQVWQDNVQVLDKANIQIGYNDKQNPYWKIGLYKHTGKSDYPTRFLYYDRVRIGDAKARYVDVAPKK